VKSSSLPAIRHRGADREVDHTGMRGRNDACSSSVHRSATIWQGPGSCGLRGSSGCSNRRSSSSGSSKAARIRFRADLARRSGLSAMRITQILALLRLALPILDYIRTLPPGTAERFVTERSLRPLTHLKRAAQLTEAARILPGYARSRHRAAS